MSGVFGIAALWVICGFVVIWVCYHPAYTDDTEPLVFSEDTMTVEDETNRILAEAARHREQIEAHEYDLRMCAIRLIAIYNEPAGSDEADTLMACPLEGADFNEAIEKVQAIKLHKHKRGM